MQTLSVLRLTFPLRRIEVRSGLGSVGLSRTMPRSGDLYKGIEHIRSTEGRNEPIHYGESRKLRAFKMDNSL